MERVLCVDSVQVATLESKPPQFAITANGKVPSSGWTQPELTQWFYVVPPQDGIQDYDFVAQPPSGIVLPVVTPISVFHPDPRDPRHYWGKGKPLKGVRIHARENSMEAKLDPKKSMEFQVRAAPRGGEVPWPWLSRGDSSLMAGEDPFPWRRALLGGSDDPFPLSASLLKLLLIGRPLRVYHTGDALTDDFVRNRVNIELSKTTELIVDAWLG
jgi:hypothetical protein